MFYNLGPHCFCCTFTRAYKQYYSRKENRPVKKNYKSMSKALCFSFVRKQSLCSIFFFLTSAFKVPGKSHLEYK